MKLFKLYKNLINEGTIEACISKFGNELFSPQMGGYEINTPTEDKYVELFQNYSNNSNFINSDFINMANDLNRCLSNYPNIQYRDGFIYKGNNIKLGDLFSIFDNVTNNIRVGQPFNLIYAPKQPIQSWSDDEDVALNDFGSSGPKLNNLINKFKIEKDRNNLKNLSKDVKENYFHLGVPLLLKYRVQPTDLVFKGNFFKYIARQEENEVLRLDNRPIQVTAKIIPMELSNDIFKLLESIKLNTID